MTGIDSDNHDAGRSAESPASEAVIEPSACVPDPSTADGKFSVSAAEPIAVLAPIAPKTSLVATAAPSESESEKSESSEPEPSGPEPSDAELIRLDPDRIHETAARLHRRICERFPSSGLSRVCGQLEKLSGRAKATTELIATPNKPMRLLSYSVIGLIVVGSLAALVVAASAGQAQGPIGWSELVQIGESAINDIVLLGAAIYFFASLERRKKRSKVVEALGRLRTVAHLIDVHQISKNPESLQTLLEDTESSRSATFTSDEMARYLDYCSEMLALTGIVAAVYGEGFDDAEAVKVVNGVEDLCIAMQRQIWQKIIILETRMPTGNGRPSIGTQGG